MKKKKNDESLSISPFKPEKHQKRLEANKKSAQASRERKKILKGDLEFKLQELFQQNQTLSKEIIQLETENKVLKNEFIQLQNIISQSTLPLLGSTLKFEEAETSNTFSGTAFMYLLIVLETFSQHFTSLLPKTNPVEIQTVPITVK